MFRPALRAVALARRRAPASLPRAAALSTTALRRSEHQAPSLYGPGGKAGEVPSDVDQATGLERLQLMGELEGVEIFDKEPLDSSRIGTLKDPILVTALDTHRIVGCTGSPADSHDTIWFDVTMERPRRCPECGSAYLIDFQGDPSVAHAHH